MGLVAKRDDDVDHIDHVVHVDYVDVDVEVGSGTCHHHHHQVGSGTCRQPWRALETRLSKRWLR